jgi:hypothetical protein
MVTRLVRDHATVPLGARELWTTFVMRPDYGRVKTVQITSDVAETYAPLTIAVTYGGQTGLPKPFLMIVTWVRTPEGWKMATDVALPVPDGAARGS